MQRPLRNFIACAALVFSAWTLLVSGCDQIPRNSTEKNNLAALQKVTIPITGRTSYAAYVADQDRTRQLGLMNVTTDELPEDQGMIFVFDSDMHLNFWMRNTIIPLDIAYIRSDGTIVKTYTMEPLNEMGYPSIEPARFALETRAGQFAAHGIQAGDHVELPLSLFED